MTDKEKEFEFRLRYEKEQEAQKQQQEAAASKEDKVGDELNKMMYGGAGAALGAGLEAKRGLGRFAQNIARAADPELMAEAKLKADLNAVEKYGRTQHRVPGMPMEKPGLYFGQPTYELESKRAREEIAKMLADPDYQQKVLAEQKPNIAQYQKRVSPSMAQRVGNFLGRTPLGMLGGAAVGAGAGMQAADAVGRYNKGDMLGATLGGLGTLGTGIAMIPHPVARVGGTALSLGAEGLNAYIDILKKNNPLDRFLQNNPLAPVGEFQNKQQEQQFMQQNPPAPPPPQNRAQPMPVRMKKGGSVKGYDDGGLVQPMVASMDPLTMPQGMLPPKPTVTTQPTPFNGTMYDTRNVQGTILPTDANYNELMTTGMPSVTPPSMPFNGTMYDTRNVQGTILPTDAGYAGPMPKLYGQGPELPTNTGGSVVQMFGGMPPPMLRSTATPMQPRLPRLGRTPMRPRPMPNLSPIAAPMAGSVGPRPAVAPIERSMRAQSPLNMMALPRAIKPRTQRPMAFAKGGEVFDPEGSGYDYKTALAYGMGPDGEGENLGHWGSVAPTSDDERMLKDLPRESYVMLKGKAHETFKKAEEAEKKRGFKTVKSDERYYSVPEYAKGGSTTPAWQRSEGKSPSGGLNAVGRASYKRETGGELKAPQPEGGSRKKSFCARMGGMKKKLTSSKTANDPDSRINKALRKWKC